MDNLIIENILAVEKFTTRAFEKVNSNGYFNNLQMDLDRINAKIEEKNDNINNLFNLAQQAGIEGPQLQQRFDSLINNWLN